ncbi:DUF417 family protein [Shewanella baltica]|uniref:DUF417 family protein n=1 Tax=Shewanella baltica TaxID=62322 RepID=UPI003D0863F3
MQHRNLESKLENTGYILSVVGMALILAWIGIYKFTPTEAALIEPLVANHPLMGWLYSFLSVQVVSNIIGATEIIVAMGLIAGFKNTKIGYISGVASAVIFATTLTFLITTPNTWKFSDGVLITNFFLLKDFLFIAASLSIIAKNRTTLRLIAEANNKR